MRLCKRTCKALKIGECAGGIVREPRRVRCSVGCRTESQKLVEMDAARAGVHHFEECAARQIVFDAGIPDHRVGNLVVRIHGHRIGHRARYRRGQICLEAQGHGGGRLLRQRACCRKGRLVGHLTRQRIQVGLDVKHAEAGSKRHLVLPGKPFSGRLPGDADARRPVIVMAMKQRRGWARDATIRRHRRDAMHLGEVRTHGEIRDVSVDFRGRSECLIAHAVRQREFREHVPVVGGVADEAPVAEVRGRVAILNLRIRRVAEKKIREIVSDARPGGEQPSGNWREK